MARKNPHLGSSFESWLDDAGIRDQVTKEAAPRKRKAPRLTREEFAKISEVEGRRLSEAMQQAFADFDRRGLSPEERRQAIIHRFKPAAK